MVVKSQIKFIRSLHQKKYRDQSGLFLAEGNKTVESLLNARIQAKIICATHTGNYTGRADEVLAVTTDDLKKMSALKTPNRVIGVFRIPGEKEIGFEDWIIALESVRDPGNLGTIIRLCDWFGIATLVCSPDSVDVYNPKVLQATMGSVARVNVVYEDIKAFVARSPIPVLGAFMKGIPVAEAALPPWGVLLLGSESHGISDEVGALLHGKIGVPAFGEPAAESLNVAMATSILLYELRRGNALIQR